jgi:hypothetical protein
VAMPMETSVSVGVEAVAPVAPALPAPAEKVRERPGVDVSEDAALDKALKAVEREQYLRQVKLETDVSMFGYSIDPFSGR